MLGGIAVVYVEVSAVKALVVVSCTLLDCLCWFTASHKRCAHMNCMLFSPDRLIAFLRTLLDSMGVSFLLGRSSWPRYPRTTQRRHQASHSRLVERQCPVVTTRWYKWGDINGYFGVF
jgi:hypothetical protein